MTPWRRVLEPVTQDASGKVTVRLQCGHSDSFNPALPLAVILRALLQSTRPCKACEREKVKETGRTFPVPGPTGSANGRCGQSVPTHRPPDLVAMRPTIDGGAAVSRRGPPTTRGDV